MIYYLDKDARIIVIQGVPVIGNVRNGSFILLNDRGKNLIERIEESENIQEDTLEENLHELLISALESDILHKGLADGLDETEETKRGIYSAYVHVTHSCNLHCIGCYSDNCDRNKRADLSLEKIEKILFKLSKSGLQVLLISGGEPFLRKDIIEILKYAKKELAIPKIIIGTNGTIQDPDLYESLQGLVDNVSISIDGYDAESADIIRDKGTFSKVIRTIQIMKNCRIPMTLLPTIHKFNYKNVPNYIELANELDIPLGFSLLTCNHTDTILDKYILGAEEFKEFVAMNTDYNCSVGDTPLDLKHISFKTSCGAGKNIISVDASGDVYPCHIMQNSEYRLGNILGDSLEDMLKSTINQHFCGSNVEGIADCKECEYKYFCGGGCKARSFFHFHSLCKGDMYCDGYKNNFERLGKYFRELANGI